MSVDEAIGLIPPGWHLRLTHWEDRGRTGWAAELFYAHDDCVVVTAETPAEAVRLAAEEAGRLDPVQNPLPP